MKKGYKLLRRTDKGLVSYSGSLSHRLKYSKHIRTESDGTPIFVFDSLSNLSAWAKHYIYDWNSLEVWQVSYPYGINLSHMLNLMGLIDLDLKEVWHDWQRTARPRATQKHLVSTPIGTLGAESVVLLKQLDVKGKAYEYNS